MRSSQEFSTDQPEMHNEGNRVNLPPGIPVNLDPNSPQREKYGYNVVTTVEAGNKEFLLLDIRKGMDSEGLSQPYAYGPAFTTPFLLVESTYDPNGTPDLYKGLRFGETITIGRRHLQDRFSYANNKDMTLSGTHFNIRLTDDGNLTITDLESKNGTKIFQNEQKSHQKDPWQEQDEFLENLRRQKEEELAAKRAAQQKENERRKREQESAAREAVNDAFEAAESKSEREAFIANIDDEKLRRIVVEEEKQFEDVPIAEFAEVMGIILERRDSGVEDRNIYIELVRKLHPDQNKHNKYADLLFRAVSSAYDPRNKRFKF